MRDELADRRVCNKAASSDDDEVLGGQGHLGHEVGGDEDRTPFCRKGFEQVAYPDDAFRVQAVNGFVEKQDSRIAQQRRRHAETLSHAE